MCIQTLHLWAEGTGLVGLVSAALILQPCDERTQVCGLFLIYTNILSAGDSLDMNIKRLKKDPIEESNKKSPITYYLHDFFPHTIKKHPYCLLIKLTSRGQESQQSSAICDTFQLVLFLKKKKEREKMFVCLSSALK